MSLTAELCMKINRYVEACGGQWPLFKSDATPEIRQAWADLEAEIERAMGKAAIEAVERALAKLPTRREP